MARQAIARSGNLAFEGWTSGNGLIVAKVAIRVIGHFVIEFDRGWFIRVGDCGHWRAIIAGLKMTGSA